MARKNSGGGGGAALLILIVFGMIVKYWAVLFPMAVVGLIIWGIVKLAKGWSTPESKPQTITKSTSQTALDLTRPEKTSTPTTPPPTPTKTTIPMPTIRIEVSTNYQSPSSPKESTYVPPYRTDSTIYGASAQPVSPNSVWIPKGKTVEKDGYTIRDGLVYFGSGLRNIRGWGPEPALIDPALPVDKNNPDRAGTNMGYWSSYSEIHPASRAAYLEWLSTGKSDPSAYIGYVFLYFYGLERRALIDIKNSALAVWDNTGAGALHKTAASESSLASAQAELEIILAEAKRLLAIYGNNGSFSSYCSRFIDVIEAMRSKEKLYTKAPTYCLPCNDIPLSVKLALGQIAVDGVLLPAEWAYAWVETDPMSYLRTPAKRCRDELRNLFVLKYAELFNAGCKLKQNKTKLKFFYRPASGSFGGQLEIPVNDLPDVTVLKEPITKLRMLAQACTNELDAYSRYLGRKNISRDSIEAITLLPPALIAKHEGAEYRNLSNLLDELKISEQPVKVEFSRLLQLLPSIGREGFGKREATSLSLVLARVGAGIEPDIRFGNILPKAGESVMLFRIAETSPNSPSPEYSVAMVLMHLASSVAGADGTVSPEEERHLEEHIESWLHLPTDERTRLKAHTQWLLTSFPGMNGIKKRLEELRTEQKESIARFLVSVAQADGYIDPTEIKVLSKIYGLLGLDPQNLYSHAHTAAAEPVTVQIADVSKPGFAIPAPPAKATGGVSLDMSSVEAKLAETVAVSAILNNIFTDDEPVVAPTEQEQVSATETIGSLDSETFAFMRILATKLLWAREELEQLASEYSLMLDGTLDSINDAAYDHFGGPFFDGDDPIEIDPEFAKEIAA